MLLVLPNAKRVPKAKRVPIAKRVPNDNCQKNWEFWELWSEIRAHDLFRFTYTDLLPELTSPFMISIIGCNQSQVPSLIMCKDNFTSNTNV